MKTVLTIVGARPQFIKAAAVSRAFSRNKNLKEVMVHTGQHFDADMSDVFFEELEIPKPAYNLDISGGHHGEMTGRMLAEIEKIILLEQPDAVLVYGDTNSTLAGAVAASKLHVPVMHVEAGLRSYNKKMPEEINRILTDHVSVLLFCPTQTSIDNLAQEGLRSGIHFVGDVMCDATLHAAEKSREASKILEDLKLSPNQYAVATIHRADNTETKEKLKAVLDYLKKIAKDTEVILPLHPRTRQAAERFGLDFDGLRIISPIGYLDMARLLDDCTLVLTDSGGLQKEAYFHRKLCVTLRDETEWVETIEAGWNRLWRGPDYRTPQREIEDYGKGNAAQKIVEIIEDSLSQSKVA